MKIATNTSSQNPTKFSSISKNHFKGEKRIKTKRKLILNKVKVIKLD